MHGWLSLRLLLLLLLLRLLLPLLLFLRFFIFEIFLRGERAHEDQSHALRIYLHRPIHSTSPRVQGNRQEQRTDLHEWLCFQGLLQQPPHVILVLLILHKHSDHDPGSISPGTFLSFFFSFFSFCQTPQQSVRLHDIDPAAASYLLILLLILLLLFLVLLLLFLLVV